MKQGQRWGKNRILAQDKRRIRRASMGASIVSTYAQVGSQNATATRRGLSRNTVGGHLTRAMQRAAELTQDERDEAARMRPPAAPGSPRRRALQLRRRDQTYDEIAATLGIPVTTAKRWVRQEVERLEADELTKADTARRLELERLSALGVPYWHKACDGDLKSAAFYLRIMERRARLLGLDAPMKVNIEDRLREEARRLGLNEHDVLAAAEEILRGTRAE